MGWSYKWLIIRKIIIRTFPMSTVVLTAVLFWCHFCLLLEELDKVALRGKRKIGGNLNQRKIAESKEVLGFLKLDLPDILADGSSHLALKEP